MSCEFANVHLLTPPVLERLNVCVERRKSKGIHTLRNLKKKNTQVHIVKYSWYPLLKKKI